ncbi:MAG TPA: response regulator [Caulobacteraceae bacterium]|nr:response regulator [Caulobacteraceae bacterium]
MGEDSLGPVAAERTTPLEHLRVLVLDEREVTRRTLALFLDWSGASVTCAETLSEALAFLTVRRFDAILTDIRLPGVGLRGGRPVLAGIAGPNAWAPVLPIDGRVHDSLETPAHAIGFLMEIGGTIDPARICRELLSLEPRPPRVAAA